jgi:hypothetical protein
MGYEWTFNLIDQILKQFEIRNFSTFTVFYRLLKNNQIENLTFAVFSALSNLTKV